MQVENMVSRISGYLQQRSSNTGSMLTRKGHSIYPFSVVVWKCKDKPIATGRSRSNRTNEVNPHMKPWWMNRDWMQLRVRGKWLPTGSLTDITSSNLYSVLMIISHLHAARVNEQKISNNDKTYHALHIPQDALPHKPLFDSCHCFCDTKMAWSNIHVTSLYHPHLFRSALYIPHSNFLRQTVQCKKASRLMRVFVPVFLLS